MYAGQYIFRNIDLKALRLREPEAFVLSQPSLGWQLHAA